MSTNNNDNNTTTEVEVAVAAAAVSGSKRKRHSSDDPTEDDDDDAGHYVLVNAKDADEEQQDENTNKTYKKKEEENNDKDHDSAAAAAAASGIVPDMPVSSSSTANNDRDEDDVITLNVPDDGSTPPTTLQLCKILGMIDTASLASSPYDDNDSREELRGLLKRLHSWIKSYKTQSSFKASLLRLGVIFRFLLLIERHMDDYKVVGYAACICALVLSVKGVGCAALDNEFKKLVMNSCTTFLLHNGFRTCILAVEEHLPSKESKKWSAAALIYMFMSNVMAFVREKWHGSSELPSESLLPMIHSQQLMLIENEIPYELNLSTSNFIHAGVNMLVAHMNILGDVLRLDPHKYISIFNDNKVFEKVLNSCQRYEKHIFKYQFAVHAITCFAHCADKRCKFSVDNISTRLGFMKRVLSEHRSHDSAVRHALWYILVTLHRSKLKTSDEMYQIVKKIEASDATSPSNKRRCQEIIEKINS